MEETKKSGFAVAALVLGIIGAVVSLIPFINIISYIFSTLTIIFGIIAIAKKTGAMAIVALVIGLIAFVMPIFINGATIEVANDVIDEINLEMNGSSDNTETKNEGNKEYGVGEEAILGDAAIIVTKVEKSQGNDWDKPKTGKEYVIVHVTIRNKGNGNISYNPYDFAMINSQGTKETQAFTTIDSDTTLNSGELLPGGKVSGTIAFEQPKNDTGLILTYSDTIWSSKELRIKIS